MPRAVDSDRRRAEICDTVVAIAEADGFGAVTFRSVAARLCGSTSAVTHYVSLRRSC